MTTTTADSSILPKLIFRTIKASTLAWPGQPALSDSLVIKIKDGERLPLFFIGTYDQVIALAENLHGDIPFYGIRSNWGLLPPTQANIEMLGEYYAKQLLKIQPQGSFSLASFCSDSQLTWQIAQLLTGWGHDVSLLALVEKDIEENLTPLLKLGKLVGRSEYQLRKLWALPLSERYSYLAKMFKRFVSGQRAEEINNLVPVLPEGEAAFTFLPFKGKVTLFYIHGERFSFYRYKPFDRCWRPYALGGTDIFVVPGENHLNPSWVTIANILRNKLLTAN
jgi:hypothetical protein